MSNTLYRELKEKFEETFEDVSFTDWLQEYGGDVEGYSLVLVDSGGEGHGEDCETVFELDGDFYKVTYSYYSHEGTDFSYAQAFKVTPKEKLVTVYE